MLTKPQLAQILHFIAATLLADDGAPANTAILPIVGPGEPVPPAKPRGRPRKDTAAPAEQAPAEVPLTEPNPVVAVSTEQVAPAPEPVPAVIGLSYEALQKLISPLIQASRGLEVKAVLDTFAPDDFEVTDSNHYLLSLLANRPETHADFVKKIEALLI